MSHERIAALFQHAETHLLACRDALNNDEMVDMKPFEGVIRELCDLLAQMPQEEAQQYETHLAAFGEALAALTTVMEQKRDHIQAQLADTGRQQKAHTAYRTPDNSKKD